MNPTAAETTWQNKRWEIFNTFWDVLALASWITDNVFVYDNAVVTAAAYEKTDLGQTYDFRINIPGYNGPFVAVTIGFGLGAFDGQAPSYPTIIAKTKINDDWLISDDLVLTLSEPLVRNFTTNR